MSVNDAPRRVGPGQRYKEERGPDWLYGMPKTETNGAPKLSGPNSMGRRLLKPTKLREPVIDGLLRVSELMNVTAAPKQGKSYIVTDMALAGATGSHWFGLKMNKGNVIILDNELHEETSDFRVLEVANARGYAVDDYGDSLFIKNLRGQNVTIEDLGDVIGTVARENNITSAQLVVLDAWYRFQDEETDENSNSSVTAAYNKLDALAQKMKLAFALIHHTTKGNQALKSVTDTGSGAGSQSRAADAHLVIRPHEEQGCAVVDAVARSWPPLPAFVVRWKYPIFDRADELDPRDLELPKTTRRREKAPAAPAESVPEKTWTVAEFASEFITDKPQVRATILLNAEQAGISERMANKLFQAVEASDTTFLWKESGLKKYANVPQPVLLPTEPAQPKRKPGRPKKTEIK
jgi:hypothetical protein